MEYLHPPASFCNGSAGAFLRNIKNCWTCRHAIHCHADVHGFFVKRGASYLHLLASTFFTDRNPSSTNSGSRKVCLGHQTRKGLPGLLSDHTVNPLTTDDSWIFCSTSDSLGLQSQNAFDVAESFTKSNKPSIRHLVDISCICSVPLPCRRPHLADVIPLKATGIDHPWRIIFPPVVWEMGEETPGKSEAFYKQTRAFPQPPRTKSGMIGTQKVFTSTWS